MRPCDIAIIPPNMQTAAIEEPKFEAGVNVKATAEPFQKQVLRDNHRTHVDVPPNCRPIKWQRERKRWE